MSAVMLIARWGLAAVFALAGVAKAADRAGTVRSLIAFGLPAALAPTGAVLLPIAELVCAVALVPAGSAWWGALGVLALLAVFTLAIGVNLLRGRRPQCQCFGQVRSEPIGAKTLVRNALLAAMAAPLVWLGPAALEASTVSTLWLDGTAWQVLALLNGVVSALLLVALVHLLRQNGRILLRLDAVEARLGTTEPVNPEPSGLPVGAPAPKVGPSLAEAGKRVVLVFTEPTCRACDDLLPEVARWQQSFVDRVSIVVISGDQEAADAFGVTATPSAVVVWQSTIASPLAVGPEAIRVLVEDTTRLVPGDRPPPLTATDLAGNPIDLSGPNGRSQILLFWNPECSYCQELLPEIKRWERGTGAAGPVLRVVSTGSVEATVAQGLTSTLLLDPRFDTGTAFGASGTPAAIALDTNGLVASELRVGGPEVTALLWRDAR